MIIGHFDYDVAADRFTGSVLCLNVRLDEVEIVPNGEQSPPRPDYAVTARTSHGMVDIGSAWKRMSERGTPYLSVAMDGPMLDQPLNAALFMDAEGEDAVLIWTSSRTRTAPARVA